MSKKYPNAFFMQHFQKRPITQDTELSVENTARMSQRKAQELNDQNLEL